MKKLAVMPGSYDPVTKGHVEIIRRAASIFEGCEVVVMNNWFKHSHFSLEERVAFCRAALAHLSNVTVVGSEALLYEYLANRPDAVLVKGLRNGEDLLWEREQTAYNFPRCGVETLYLDAGDAWQGVSSTLVRERLSDGGDWESLVPEAVVPLLRDK
ncbi:MAG: pantetheine-phosphate adenylyltransferase [Clostridia bacterium]|nr:pantetheine-phosphate adenylyltransferase [Clostridia bacterium]